MSTVSGLLRRLSVDGEELDPTGDFTILVSWLKNEEIERSHKETYFKQVPMSGKISGNIKAKSIIDPKKIGELSDVKVHAERINGDQYNGLVSYTGDPEINESDGNIPIELTGTVDKVS